MISVDEAKKIILASTDFTRVVELPLAAAFGFVVARNIVASIDIPNFPQSSMDGYAFCFADHGNKPLKVIGEMAAGTSLTLRIGSGEAARIFTGAPLPEGADTVIMQEKIRVEGRELLLEDEKLTMGMHVRPKGAEARRGELAMAAGTYLSAAAVGFLAGIGCTHVTVYNAPSIAIILTGNELQQPGKALGFGQVYEANSIILSSALKKLGIEKTTLLFADDTQARLEQVLQQALDSHDLVLLNGGVSVGDYDYVVRAAKACGVDQKFHKIKQKPGKPLYFGTKGQKLVFGLPGNPSSSLTCFYEYVLPALEKMLRKTGGMQIINAILTHDYKKPEGLTHFIKAYYANGNVTPLHAQESFRLHSFAQANGFIVLPETSSGALAGDKVEVHLLPL